VTVVVKEIQNQDLEEVSEFLHREMWKGISPADWLRSLQLPWSFEIPHYGYQLRDNDRLVGVYTAIFSERPIRGNPERFCNLAAWFVLPDYRLHSIKLLKALLDQKNCHLTDLSPIPHVVQIMKKFGFSLLDATLTVQPNLPFWRWASRNEVITEPECIREELGGEVRQIFDDHLGLGSLRHIVLKHNGDPCLVMYVIRSRKKIPCATVLYVSDSKVLARRYKTLSHFFLLREHTFLTIFESRFLERSPVLSFQLQSPHRKLFRSSTLLAEDIDNLYSELVTLVQPSQIQ